MPRTSEMGNSKFLRQSDVGKGMLVTVTGCAQYPVDEDEKDLKWCLTFHETDKAFVLNTTNIKLCEHIFGSDNTDDWIGKPLVLYTDPTIMYAGKMTGGLRVRAPKPAGTPAPPRAAAYPGKALGRPAQAAPPVVDEIFTEDPF